MTARIVRTVAPTAISAEIPESVTLVTEEAEKELPGVVFQILIMPLHMNIATHGVPAAHRVNAPAAAESADTGKTGKLLQKTISVCTENY